MQKIKKVAIIGTNGIPSKYGGFETLIEYLADYLTIEYEITVFCSSKAYPEKLNEYKRCKLKYVPLRANGWQSILYDIVSIYKSYRKFDKILMLGASGSVILPLFRNYRHKFILNFGGLDWDRAKWNLFTRKYIKLSESLGIKYSEYLVSDNLGIQEYIQKEYRRNSIVIAYGGDQVFKVVPNSNDYIKYPFLKINYAFTVARIQTDNNIEMLIRSFLKDSLLPYILVGNWKASDYGIRTKAKYLNYAKVILLDAIYDQRELNLLRSNCKMYLHGHSAGGTNPALVEAMNLSLPILAYNNVYNRYTTENEAIYFSDSNELSKKVNTVADEVLEQVGKKMLNIAKKNYKWEIIAKKYSEVIKK